MCSGANAAYFGEGTKLTVLGKKTVILVEYCKNTVIIL